MNDPMSSTNTATNGRIERNFTFGPGVTPRVVAHNPTGTIEIRGEAREDVAVLVAVNPPDALADGLEIRVEQSGDTVTADVKWLSSLSGLRKHLVRVAITIRAPYASSATATTASGEVQIAGIAAGATVHSASGDVRVSDIAEGLTINTASGDIHAREIRGTVRLNTASGDVTIEQGAGEFAVNGTSGDVRLDGISGPLLLNTVSGDAEIRAALSRATIVTVSGDVEITTPLYPQGDYRVQSVSGDVELFVPEGTAATVSYQTLSGDVSSALPAQREGGKRKGTLIVNGGGVRVQMKSVSGDLSVRAAKGNIPALNPAPLPETSFAPAPMEDAPMMQDAPVPPAPQPQPEQSETLRILHAVERGELSIDEAMSRLDTLEDAEG